MRSSDVPRGADLAHGLTHPHHTTNTGCGGCQMCIPDIHFARPDYDGSAVLTVIGNLDYTPARYRANCSPVSGADVDPGVPCRPQVAARTKCG